MPALAPLSTSPLRLWGEESGLTLGQFVLALAVLALILLIAFFGGIFLSDDYRQAVLPAFR